MAKISIIVPVYNAEKYLKQCIDSLLNQSLTECEFIFVNDGSIDESQKIIELSQKKDTRILLINQNNLGVSAARNIGIEQATGEFIGFVDADDRIESTMFEKLYNTITSLNVDLAVCDYYTINSNKKIINKASFPYNKLLNKDYINHSIIPNFIKSSSLNACWNKLYRASIIKTIKFPEGMPLGEDGIFNLMVFNAIQNCIFIDFIGYHYFENEGSATRNIIENDYFKRALEVYKFNYQDYISFIINKNELKYWKLKRLIDSVISYCCIYFNSNDGLSFFSKIKYVKKMITNNEVQEAIRLYHNQLLVDKSKFEKFIIHCIKNKSVYKIYLACKYSQLRNKK